MVRIHREPPVEGPPGGAVAYTHFGARCGVPTRAVFARWGALARLDRFDSCTLYQICRTGSSTDQNSWPTPNRCGFNSRTAHHAGLARRSSPRSITARRWFDSNILHQFVLSMGDWQRGQMHSPDYLCDIGLVLLDPCDRLF